MCGLAGFIGAGDAGDLSRMTNALSHRGPDGVGMWADPERPVWLGHRRLTVRDPNGGRQPMWSVDERVGVVFNGEIYNDRELRAALEARGHVFQTRDSDTEVLVHGYEEWGEDLPTRLNGMFAFVVYDRERGRLLLALDRFAEKPLFYAHGSDLFAFASELGALACHPGVDRALDPLALRKFLGHGFIPSPLTPLRGVRKLPPGGRVVFDIASGVPRQDRWWRFAIRPDPSMNERSEGDLAEELRELIRDAVRVRLVSDVPLGCFLSGGLDSAAVAALAAREVKTATMRAFSIGFDDPARDETVGAARTAREVGADHTVIRLSAGDMMDDVAGMLGRSGEPIGDATIFATYRLSLETRRHVVVALSGDGADEMFAGYPQFPAMAAARRFKRWTPAPLRRGLLSMTRMLPMVGRSDDPVRADTARGMAALEWPEALWNPMWLAPATPALIDRLFGDHTPVEELYSEALELWEGSEATDPLDRALEYHAGLSLPDGILARADRGAMAASLESRAVFLDNGIVDFCARLPNRWKLRDGRRKHLFREAMRGVLSDEVLTRKKRGFDPPLCRWLRRLPIEAWGGVVDAGIDLGEIERRVRGHQSGSADNSLLLWAGLGLARGLDTLRASPPPVLMPNAA